MELAQNVVYSAYYATARPWTMHVHKCTRYYRHKISVRGRQAAVDTWAVYALSRYIIGTFGVLLSRESVFVRDLPDTCTCTFAEAVFKSVGLSISRYHV